MIKDPVDTYHVKALERDFLFQPPILVPKLGGARSLGDLLGYAIAAATRQEPLIPASEAGRHFENRLEELRQLGDFATIEANVVEAFRLQGVKAVPMEPAQTPPQLAQAS